MAKETNSTTKVAVSAKVLTIHGKPFQISEGEGNETKDATIADYILTMCGSQVPVKNNKETLRLRKIGLKLIDNHKKEIEVSQQQLELMRRLARENLVQVGAKDTMPMFSPWVQAQILEALGCVDEDDV